MANLEIFITIGLPCMILIILIFAGIVDIVSLVYHKKVRNTLEEIEDTIDSLYYEMKQRGKQKDLPKDGKKYVTIHNAARLFLDFQRKHNQECLRLRPVNKKPENYTKRELYEVPPFSIHRNETNSTYHPNC